MEQQVYIDIISQLHRMCFMIPLSKSMVVYKAFLLLSKNESNSDHTAISVPSVDGNYFFSCHLFINRKKLRL